MRDLDPCLLGCDNALAEADLLVALLSATPGLFQPEIAAVRDRIASLRNEVGRLRGLAVIPPRRHFDPEWSKLDGEGLPWPKQGGPGGDS